MSRLSAVVGLRLAFCFLLSPLAHAVETPPRLFFSDANISFTFPNHWELNPKFPYGPLFTKPIKGGEPAVIACVISAPLDNTRVSADIPPQALKELARGELEAHQPGYQRISERDRKLAGQNAYEVIWENVVSSETVRHQTLYFFVENRVYALSMQADPDTFRWLLPDFQHWSDSLSVLSRMDAASLRAPAHGGVWVHQTGGIKIPLPEEWLLGVADDRHMGAALVQGGQNVTFTATVDVAATQDQAFDRSEKREALKSVRKKALRIVSDAEDAFHGLPSYAIQYEGSQNERVIKGTDLWVLSPKGRWLFNFEGDVSLYNSLSGSLQDILKSIEFI